MVEMLRKKNAFFWPSSLRLDRDQKTFIVESNGFSWAEVGIEGFRGALGSTADVRRYQCPR